MLIYFVTLPSFHIFHSKKMAKISPKSFYKIQIFFCTRSVPLNEFELIEHIENFKRVKVRVINVINL